MPLLLSLNAPYKSITINILHNESIKIEQFPTTEMQLNKKFDNLKVLLFQKSNQHLYFENQLKIIFQYLQSNIATASIIARATDIPQKNICRYKRYPEKAGKLWEVEKDKSPDFGASSKIMILFHQLKVGRPCTASTSTTHRRKGNTQFHPF